MPPHLPPPTLVTVLNDDGSVNTAATPVRLLIHARTHARTTYALNVILHLFPTTRLYEAIFSLHFAGTFQLIFHEFSARTSCLVRESASTTVIIIRSSRWVR